MRKGGSRLPFSFYTSILEYLLQAHWVGMELTMKDGDYYYVFDSP